MKCSLKLLPGRTIHSASGKPSGRPVGVTGRGKDTRSFPFLFCLPVSELPGGGILGLRVGPVMGWREVWGEAERAAQVGSLGA